LGRKLGLSRSATPVAHRLADYSCNDSSGGWRRGCGGIEMTKALVFFFILSVSLSAQTQEPNRSGVSVTLAHLIVANPDEHARLWIDILGAEPAAAGPMRMLKLPGLFIALEKGQPSGPSNGSSIDHIGLWVRDVGTFKSKVADAHLVVASDT